VTVEQGPLIADDLLRLPKDVVRAVRVVPHESTAAPLTFVLTSFPGVYIHAGLLHDFHFPICGCDACDDDVRDLVEDLEWSVRTVVSGGYSERFDSGPESWVEFVLEEPGFGTRSGRSRTEDLPEERVKSARSVLPPEGHWMPWPELP
jgi:hypothetical protein